MTACVCVCVYANDSNFLSLNFLLSVDGRVVLFATLDNLFFVLERWHVLCISEEQFKNHLGPVPQRQIATESQLFLSAKLPALMIKASNVAFVCFNPGNTEYIHIEAPVFFWGGM